MRPFLFVLGGVAAVTSASFACSRAAPHVEGSTPTATTATAATAATAARGEAMSPAASSSSPLGATASAGTPSPTAPALPHGAAPCATVATVHGGPSCVRFGSAEGAFRWILAHEPAILAIGEAHAQRGTEGIASATKRFTDTMVPMLEGRASDLLLEAWVGDPKCKREVKQVASAQAPVKQAQAESNPNEYVAMGTRAKAAGVQPHLLRPSCEQFADLADAGADVVTASLSLIKTLTQAQATQLFQRNEAAKNGKLVVTYGGAMHNDLAPAEKLKAYSFGPELSTVTAGRYIELDLIVPEYVKKNDVWEKLPWFAAWQADTGPKDKPTLYRLGDRSFVLLFPSTPSAK